MIGGWHRGVLDSDEGGAGVLGLEFEAVREIGPINVIQNAWIVIYFGLVCGNEEFIPFAVDWQVC
jgi:hypothetical protein